MGREMDLCLQLLPLVRTNLPCNRKLCNFPSRKAINHFRYPLEFQFPVGSGLCLEMETTSKGQLCPTSSTLCDWSSSRAAFAALSIPVGSKPVHFFPSPLDLWCLIFPLTTFFHRREEITSAASATSTIQLVSQPRHGQAVLLKWMSRRIHVDTAFICYTLFI